MNRTEVIIKKNNEQGWILRRLNSESYEIWIESKNEIVILNPVEFIEVKEKT